MLQGIETIFDDKEVMLKHLKKKSFEENTKNFLAKNSHFFEEMAEYTAQAEDKTAASEAIGQCIVDAVKMRFANGRGKIDSRTQTDLNFFMIYYVFTNILRMCGDDGKCIADGVCNAWNKGLKSGEIHYTDYDTLYNSFREKIFGIF